MKIKDTVRVFYLHSEKNLPAAKNLPDKRRWAKGTDRAFPAQQDRRAGGGVSATTRDSARGNRFAG